MSEKRPTRVGMNRSCTSAPRRKSQTPHTRGDESEQQNEQLITTKNAPHAWG